MLRTGTLQYHGLAGEEQGSVERHGGRPIQKIREQIVGGDIRRSSRAVGRCWWWRWRQRWTRQEGRWLLHGLFVLQGTIEQSDDHSQSHPASLRPLYHPQRDEAAGCHRFSPCHASIDL